MFGYVTPLKDELKVKELNTFKSYYCGLCFHIKKDYGNLPRLSLNYDMTFLGILLDSLTQERADTHMKSCLTNPLKKKPIILNNKALSYAATMNVALVYYKLLDDVMDDHTIHSKVLASSLKPYTKKFSSEVTPVLKAIEDNLTKLTDLENSKTFSSIDEICHPFSLIVANILSHYATINLQAQPTVCDTLFNFGYALGKWIYMVDALDDLEKDMAKNKFNPINFLYNKDNLTYKDFIDKIRERIAFTILNCGANCKDCLLELPIYKNSALINNIISLGMMDQYTKVTMPCECNCDKKGASNESP
ncbi:MAG: DUF5685 family protein [Cellulosilyticaceae bacterium]